MQKWVTYLDDHKSQFTNELLDFLRIPSISALSEHSGDVERAAQWVADRMTVAGIEGVRVLPTEEHQVVYGEWLHGGDRPTVMIYGHYDTQPVDPLTLWSQPPFEPTIKEGRVYARGASDDKGNMLVTILAVEALLQTEGKLPVNLKFFFEGQEEISSPGLQGFLAANRDLLACDMVVSADGLQWDEDHPALLLGMKGSCFLEIDVLGPRNDLHSGLYGGAIQNPIHALAQILSSMRDPDGRVLVRGFYDDVISPSEEERADTAAIPFDVDSYKEEVGVRAIYGEPGYSTLERTWLRPTLEVNGIWGGFQGEGLKTVLPSQAHAKISCRLVQNQDPAKIVDLIATHIEEHTPPGVKVTVRPMSSGTPAYVIPANHPGNEAARAVLESLYGRPPYHCRLGGTLPVAPLFLKELSAYTVTLGFGLQDEGAHSFNEFFRLSNFELGQKAYCQLLERLGEGP
ncbi:MAG: dipeptidase [Dehalococcoidia bacterium]|nr:dipeptidase [Dehalococcoidia bacterium]